MPSKHGALYPRAVDLPVQYPDLILYQIRVFFILRGKLPLPAFSRRPCNICSVCGDFDAILRQAGVFFLQPDGVWRRPICYVQQINHSMCFLWYRYRWIYENPKALPHRQRVVPACKILLQNRERKMHTMLDLRNMSDAEFSVFVAPPAPQSVLQVTIHEDDHVQLNSKLASQFAKKPVQLRFNPDLAALQIALAEEPYADHFTFPKSGRKTIRGIADYFRKAHIPLPVVFRGILLDGSAKWRGERQANPFGKQSTTSRSTRKK